MAATVRNHSIVVARSELHSGALTICCHPRSTAAVAASGKSTASRRSRSAANSLGVVAMAARRRPNLSEGNSTATLGVSLNSSPLARLQTPQGYSRSSPSTTTVWTPRRRARTTEMMLSTGWSMSTISTNVAAAGISDVAATITSRRPADAAAFSASTSDCHVNSRRMDSPGASISSTIIAGRAVARRPSGRPSFRLVGMATVGSSTNSQAPVRG